MQNLCTYCRLSNRLSFIEKRANLNWLETNAPTQIARTPIGISTIIHRYCEKTGKTANYLNAKDGVSLACVIHCNIRQVNKFDTLLHKTAR